MAQDLFNLASIPLPLYRHLTTSLCPANNAIAFDKQYEEPLYSFPVGWDSEIKSRHNWLLESFLYGQVLISGGIQVPFRRLINT